MDRYTNNRLGLSLFGFLHGTDAISYQWTNIQAANRVFLFKILLLFLYPPMQIGRDTDV